MSARFYLAYKSSNFIALWKWIILYLPARGAKGLRDPESCLIDS